jgi:hypothetical protein
MIQPRAYEPAGALAIMQRLDPHDMMEAALVRGRSASGPELFADWHAMQGARVASWLLVSAPSRGAVPFGLVGLANTGQAGVAQAAFLSRDHARFRRELVAAAGLIAREMPVFCAQTGIHRIEARAWADHPTAARFLTALGFECEARMPGFGPTGAATFLQFAWVSPQVAARALIFPTPPEQEN